MRDWRPSLGAVWSGRATTFRVWAPAHLSIDLVLERDAEHPRPLRRESDGYWAATIDDVTPGDLYRYRIDGDVGRTFPDPASRFQPLGVHGPSEVVDPSAFTWTDAVWHPHALRDLVFYEVHVGTFTPEGTFRGVIDRLGYLAALGITALELMPVGDFPGGRNWGYDVAAMFAPARAYGDPADLRALVDAAHACGLSVFLDVVYNHVGPDGAYINAFSSRYFNTAHTTAWGAGVNLDGPEACHVRRFFIENALHWVREYHIDGLRLDATHALVDDGPRHFLAELTDVVRAEADRPVHFVAEDHRNLTQLLRPTDQGGYGLDAVWADDFHHQVRVHTAHDAEGYYADYTGSTTDLAETLRQGWYYTGQVTRSTGKPRGTDPSGLPPEHFVICIQNHDQIGNRADGARISRDIDLATFRAISTLLLMAPHTPLLFMGQEWAASSPFLFFTDHHEELGIQVTQGRRAEFSSFRAFADPGQRASIPDPQVRETFTRSRLVWDETSQSPHRETLALYRRLLELRRLVITRACRASDIEVRELDAHSIAITLPSATVVARLSGSGPVPIRAGDATMVLSTEHPAVAPDPMPIRITSDCAVFERPGAVVLSTCLAPMLPIDTRPSVGDTGGRSHGDADD